ncbi:DISARM system SNF2-like helicase DrmD, partial [Breznakiellaceae bacterium SP9]
EEGTYSTTIYEHSFGHLSFTAWKHCCFSLLTGSKLGKIKTADGYQESFTSLLELLDDQRFARTIMPDEKKLQQVMVRRLKSDIVDPQGNPVFPKRRLEILEVKYTEEERQIHLLLKAYTEDRQKTVKGTRYEYGAEFIHILLKKRLFSSPRAFAMTLEKHRSTLLNGRSATENKDMDERILRSAILKTEEEYSDDSLAEEARNEAIEAAARLAPPLSDGQKEMLPGLSAWAAKARNRPDSKAEALLSWLENHLKTDGKWNGKRVILFTEFLATHSWLQEILASHGYAGERMMYLYGGMTSDEREVVKAAFQASPDVSPVRILLATDAASEGIDLQNHCNYLIHIEIPWNPNVMEQRNGRIDRHGQKEKDVFIWHPAGIVVGKDKATVDKRDMEADHEYLWRAVQKVDAIREDLGSVGEVIAKQIEEAMLGRRKNLDTTAVEVKAASAKKFISAEKQLKERIDKLHSKLLEARDDFNLSPKHIYRTVKVGLELAKMPALKPIDWPGCKTLTVFEVPSLPGSWGKAAAGLEHPHTHKIRPVTFDHDLARGRDDIVLMHLNHRLVQMCLRLLREEIWSLDDIKHLNRVMICTVPDNELGGPAVVIWSRLVISGGDQRRLHEELTLAGGELKHNGFTRIPLINKLESLVKNAVTIEPSASLFDILKKRFTDNENQIMEAITARSRDRLQSLKNTIEKQKEKEITDIVNILNELELSIKREIKPESDNAQPYLEGFSPEELAQQRKDYSALKERLTRIPKEKDDEKTIIEKRYADPVDRTFPVAVIFLVPQSQVKKAAP